MNPLYQVLAPPTVGNVFFSAQTRIQCCFWEVLIEKSQITLQHKQITHLGPLTRIGQDSGLSWKLLGLPWAASALSHPSL
jgi:hypothetical protein